MIALFMVHRLALLLLAGLVILLLGKSARLSLGYLIRGLRLVWILALLTFVFNAMLTPGSPMPGLEGLPVTREGLLRGGAMAMRLFLLVLATSLLSLTTSPILLTDAVEKLLAPFRRLGVPSHELAMVSTIALRFVPTLALETERIMKAQLARGACLDRGNPLVRARALIPVLVPLFVSAFRHAEDLAVAMEARCYRGGEGRTRLRDLHMKAADWWGGLGGLLFLVALVGLDRWAGRFG
jgi:energy-coupling factor transport system permease protein